MRLICGAFVHSGTGSYPNRFRSMAAHLGGAMTILALGLLAQGLLVSPAAANRIAYVVADEDSLEVIEVDQNITVSSSNRDSLMVEIRRYSRMVADLRDSLAGDGGEINLSDEQREVIEQNIAEVSTVIENIGMELGQLEFEIKNNTISLVNEAGEGIIINIPEDLDEHLSEGLEILSQVILSELPDSIDFDSTDSWDWSGFAPNLPKKPGKVIHGNIIKIRDDLHISSTEDVRGDVVVVFGSAEVAGRVDGNVVVVFGNLLLDESAEVTGQVVSIGGRLDSDPDARTSDVVSVDLWPGDGGLSGIFENGTWSFLVSQGTFMLTLMLAVVAVVAAPRSRFEAISRTIQVSPGPSVGVGLIMAMVSHLTVGILMAVLILTVIGIPLALLVFLALVVAVVVSVAVAAANLGQRICSRIGSGCSSRWLAVIVGMCVLHLASFLGLVLSMADGMEVLSRILVGLGVFIKTLAFLFGLGALTISRLGSRPPA